LLTLQLAHRRGGADDLQVRLSIQQRGQGVGHDPMVVDHEDTDPWRWPGRLHRVALLGQGSSHDVRLGNLSIAFGPGEE
jgi:hypothetical protein